MRKPRLIFLLLAFYCMTGCNVVIYYEPTSEVMLPSPDNGLLPQEATSLTFKLDYRPVTKFQPAESWKMYRYKVLINGKPYSYGVLDEPIDNINIPLIANDSHEPAAITAYGSMALDFSREETWEEWHQIYSAGQACLEEGSEPKYSVLEGARLIITIDGTPIFMDLEQNGSAEAFKRYLFDFGKERVPRVVILKDCIALDSSKEQYLNGVIYSMIPMNYGSKNDTFKAGSLFLYLDRFIFSLKDMSYWDYGSLIGSVSPESEEAFRTVAESISTDNPYSVISFSLDIWD